MTEMLLFTVRGAADFVKTRPANVRYWIRQGWLRPAKAIDGINLYRASDIQDARRTAKASRHAANVRGGRAHRRLDS